MSKKKTTLSPKTKRAKSNPIHPSSSYSPPPPILTKRRSHTRPPRKATTTHLWTSLPSTPPPAAAFTLSLGTIPTSPWNFPINQTTSGQFPPHRAARLSSTARLPPTPRSEPRRPPDSRVPCATYLRRRPPRLPRLVGGCSGWVVARGEEGRGELGNGGKTMGGRRATRPQFGRATVTRGGWARGRHPPPPTGPRVPPTQPNPSPLTPPSISPENPFS